MLIAVPLQAPTMAEMLALIDRAASEPADIIELRLDALREPPDIHALLAACHRPAIVTCRAAREGGGFQGNEAGRLALLRQAIDANAAYVDIEADAVRDFLSPVPADSRPVAPPGAAADGNDPSPRGFAPAGTRTRLIASMHDFNGVPPDFAARVAALARLPVDAVKFAVTARDPADNLRVFAALDQLRATGRPAIGLAMGEFGEASRVLAGRHGAFLTFGSLAAGRESAPGQPTVRELASLYRVGALTGRTGLYAVAGDPIGHSLSPLVHNAALAVEGIDACYLRFRVRDFPSFLREVAGPLGLKGLSVTIPHKEIALATIAAASGPDINDEARAIGAANTLTLLDDGAPRWAADNFDGLAALDAINAALTAAAPAPAGAPALVLGAGGTARALLYRLTREGWRATVTARRSEAALELAATFGARAVPWEERDAAAAARVVVNTTPVGMFPNVDATPLAGHHFRSGQIVLDAVYRPRRTRLLTDAARDGATTVEGLEMFAGQAARQFQRWHRRPAPRAAMMDALLNAE